MPSLAAVRAANAAFSPSFLPIAIFVGGTSGIGQGVAQAFARHTQGNAHIILVGRNRSAAESIIATFPKPSSDSAAVHEFVQCDATLMKNVHATTSALLSRLPKVNFLVLSPGILTVAGRDETTEGIDKKLALHYYARWKFTHDLLPLLRKAKDAGEDAKVLDVLAAGMGGAIDVDDLGLRKNYSLTRAGLVTPTYADLMLQSFAEQEPDIAYTHAYPGFVHTPIFKFRKGLLRAINPLVDVLVYPFATSAVDCGEFMLYSMLQGEKGVYRRDNRGEDIGKKRYFGSDEERKRLWEHTVEETTKAVNA